MTLFYLRKIKSLLGLISLLCLSNSLQAWKGSAFGGNIAPYGPTWQSRETTCFDGEILTSHWDALTKTLLVGGNFKRAGVCTGHGAFVSKDNDKDKLLDPGFDLNQLKINGNVTAILKDTPTSWYIGGDFTKVGMIDRRGLARITKTDSVYTLDMSFNPNANFVKTKALVKDGSYLYVGGGFSEKNLTYGAPLETTTGQVPPVYEGDSSFDGIVLAVVADGVGGWIVGGEFITYQGIHTPYLARINQDGSLDPHFKIRPNDVVKALEIDGNRLYAGGNFHRVNGNICAGVVKINLSTPNVESCEFGIRGGVNTLKKVNSELYVGGAFTKAKSSYVGYAGILSPTSGELISLTLNIEDGVIHSAFPDGLGGWYIGGSFTRVNGYPRKNLAKINSDGSLDVNWLGPQLTGMGIFISSFAIRNDQLIIGGNFSFETNQNLIVLNKNSGSLENEQIHNPDGVVKSLLIDGNNLYLGGDFTKIGAQDRVRLARWELSSNTLSSWNPQVDNSITAMALSGSMLYVGGIFTSVGGVTRNRLASFNLISSELTEWNPNSNGTINALVIDGTTLYVGGSFTNIGGSTRNRLMAFDLLSGNLTSWNPNSNNSVQALSILGTTLFVGGSFTSIEGSQRNQLAAFDMTNGSLTPWNPNIDNQVVIISGSGSHVLFGTQNLFSIGGIDRKYLAAFDVSTNQLISEWNPNSNGVVSTLATDGSTLYVGGNFSMVGGEPRTRLAAYELPIGNLKTWNPNSNGVVYALAIDGATLYVGGNFSIVGGQTRNRLAAISTLTGLATGWNPNPLGSTPFINALVINGSTLYVGGNFASIGGQPRAHLAAFDIFFGNLLPWDPSPNGVVWSLASGGLQVYVGGQFTNIAQKHSYLSRVFGASGSVDITWVSQTNNEVRALALVLEELFVGGLFSNIGGEARSRLAAINTSTGLATGWNPNPSGGSSLINTLAIDDTSNTLYAGGSFATIAATSRSNVASFSISSKNINPWVPNPNGPVHTLLVDESSVYIGGNFTQAKGIPRMNMAQVNKSSGDLSGGSPTSFNASVYSLYKDPTQNLYVGGAFTQVNGQARYHLIKLDNLNNLTPWDPSPGGPVYSISEDGAQNLFVGGDFTHLTSEPQPYLAALDETQNFRLKKWNLNLNGDVRSIFQNQNEIYIGGAFTQVDGQSRSRVASFRNDTGALTSFDPQVEGISINAISRWGTKILLGGNFSRVLGQNRTHLAMLERNSESPLLSLNPNIQGGEVKSLLVDGDNLILAGDFTSIQGNTSLKYLARANLSTTSFISLNHRMTDPILTLAKNNSNELFFSGSLSSSSKEGNQIQKLDLTNFSITPFSDFVFNGSIHSLVVHEGKLSVGGDFDAINNEKKGGAVYINLISPTTTYSYTFEKVKTLTPINNKLFLGSSHRTWKVEDY